MSRPIVDYKGRRRSKTIAFRVSPEEDEVINALVAASGMTKQDYITSRLECRDINVSPNSGAGFGDGRNDRETMELLAVSWLVENDFAESVGVRFDKISMIVVGEDRALLRHHINAFGEA